MPILIIYRMNAVALCECRGAISHIDIVVFAFFTRLLGNLDGIFAGVIDVFKRAIEPAVAAVEIVTANHIVTIACVRHANDHDRLAVVLCILELKELAVILLHFAEVHKPINSDGHILTARYAERTARFQVMLLCVIRVDCCLTMIVVFASFFAIIFVLVRRHDYRNESFFVCGHYSKSRRAWSGWSLFRLDCLWNNSRVVSEDRSKDGACYYTAQDHGQLLFDMFFDKLVVIHTESDIASNYVYSRIIVKDFYSVNKSVHGLLIPETSVLRVRKTPVRNHDIANVDTTRKAVN